MLCCSFHRAHPVERQSFCPACLQHVCSIWMAESRGHQLCLRALWGSCVLFLLLVLLRAFVWGCVGLSCLVVLSFVVLLGPGGPSMQAMASAALYPGSITATHIHTHLPLHCGISCTVSVGLHATYTHLTVSPYVCSTSAPHFQCRQVAGLALFSQLLACMRTAMAGCWCGVAEAPAQVALVCCPASLFLSMSA